MMFLSIVAINGSLRIFTRLEILVTSWNRSDSVNIDGRTNDIIHMKWLWSRIEHYWILNICQWENKRILLIDCVYSWSINEINCKRIKVKLNLWISQSTMKRDCVKNHNVDTKKKVNDMRHNYKMIMNKYRDQTQ